MESFDRQRVLTGVAVGILLLTVQFPEFEGHTHGTTARVPGKNLNSFTRHERSLNDFKTENRTLQEEIEIQLQSIRAKNFLGGLSSQFQREIVLTNLRLCPFVPLCQFEFKFDQAKYDFLIHNMCCSPCSCDKEKCTLSGTCCPDILLSKNDTPELTDDVRETCVPTEIKGTDESSVHRIKTISVCPPHTESELVTKCVRNYESNLRDLEIEDITLVSDTSSDRIYRNKFCAECHFVNSSSRVYWLPGIECHYLHEVSIVTNSMELIEQIVQGNVSCDIKFQQPKRNMKIKSCTSTISVCNFTGLWDSYDPAWDMACGLYGVAVRSHLSFRNVFCARCNGFNPKPTDICAQGSIIEAPVNFAGFLRLSDSIQYSDNCGKHEKYDSIKEKCRQAVCSVGRRLKNGHCELIFDGMVTIDLDINLRLEPQDPIPLQEAYEIAPAIKSVVRDEIFDRVDRQRICSTQVLLQSNIHVSSNQSNRLSDKWGQAADKISDSVLVFYLLRIHIFGEAHLEKTVDSLKSLNGTLVSLNGTRIAKRHLEPLPLFEMKLVNDVNKWKFDKMSSVIKGIFEKKFSDVNKWKFDKMASVINGIFEKKFSENGFIDIDYAVSVSDSFSLFDDDDNMLQIPFLSWNDWSRDDCKREKPRYTLLSLKSCPMFKIPWEEFDWKENVNGIEAEGTPIRLGTEDYTIVTKSQPTYLLVCVDTYLEKFKPLEQSVRNVDWGPVKTAKIVTSLICVCASVICLIFSLVTYCMFKQLRTIPGKNNIALIVSLIFAQVFYLVGGTANFDRNSQICKTVGLFTHFFWLVAMFWMNICTFHMCQVLLKTRNVSQHGNFRKYVYYHLYCISMTLICVSVNVGVSMATSENTDIGYGKLICFVSSQRMVDFTFGVPSVLVVVSNFSMFLAVVISLKRRPSVRKNVKNDTNYFVVFIKLSTVTGITWIFGFLYMWTGIEAFSFLFIILNASQGLFIMLAFVCNKRIITLYKELLRRRDRSSSSTGKRSPKTLSTAV